MRGLELKIARVTNINEMGNCREGGWTGGTGGMQQSIASLERCSGYDSTRLSTKRKNVERMRRDFSTTLFPPF